MSVLVVLFTAVRDLFRRRSDLQAELLALRHQVLVLQRRLGQRRVQLHPADRVCWVLLSRLWPRWREALSVVKPETVIAWHRAASAGTGDGRSRARPVGRPRKTRALIDLIRSMHRATRPGRARIHGELLKWASTSRSRRCRRICQGHQSNRRHRAGGRFFITTSPR